MQTLPTEKFPNILLVDDTPSNLELLEIVIGKLEVNIIMALSGKEALEKTRGIELAVAIIDVLMPEMSGFELAVKLNQDRQGAKVPLIFITASHINESDMFKGYNSGAIDYINKPFKSFILLSKIKVFLELFNQRQTIIKDALKLKETTDELIRVNKTLRRSEEKFRSYVDNAPDGVFVVDRSGNYTDVNNAACHITGYTKKELLKMTIQDILPDEAFKTGLEHFEILKQTGKASEEFLFKPKFGDNRWWSVDAVKLTNTSYLGFVKDITERKTTEEILLLSESRLAEAQHIANIGSWTWDMVANTATWSKEMFRIFDIDPENFDGNPNAILSILHPDDVEIFTKTKNNNISDGKSPSLEYRVIHRDGSVHTLFANGRYKFDINGKPIQGFGTVQDISEQKQAEEALRKSEELFRSVVNNSLDLTTLTDDKGNIVFVGPQSDSIFGYPGEFFYGKKMPDIIHPEDKELCSRMWEKVFTEGLEIRGFEYRIIDKMGEVRWVSHSAALLKIDDKLLGVQSSISNITERKQVEQALKLSDEKYKTMLNASPDGILLINLKGIITEVSEIGLELLSAENRETLIGKHFLKFVPHEEIRIIPEIVEKTMNEGIAQNIELKIRKENQSIFLGEISSTLIQGPDGIPFSFMITVRDISQRKKMETTQIHADRMASLGEMASGIAHEINQPLNTLSLVMDNILYESMKDGVALREYLQKKSDKIFENITRIRNIIDHVRAFSRSHDDYVHSAFDINVSILNAVSMISEQFKHLGIVLSLQLENKLPQIFGNTFKFEQVILNLLSNARDALLERKNKDSSFIGLQIGIVSFQEKERIVVEITDNGIGVSKEDIDHIMLPFYTTKDTGKGTGLGLSISYRIIKEMNGSIEVVGRELEGTSFILFLPVKNQK